MAVWLLAWFCLVMFVPVGVHASALDDKLAAFDVAQTQTMDAVADILKTALAENRSAEAYAALKSWLAANPTDSQAVLVYAGRAAQYAGEFSDAASFYRKLLKQKNLNAKLAEDVVPTFYRLLLNDMRDEQSAYLFMREEGHRLGQYGIRARQFDAWFLRKARERGDWMAIADRLAAIYNRDTGDIPLHAAHLDALLAHIETYRHGGEELFAALKGLAAAKHTTPQTRARLNWVMEIVPVIPVMVKQFETDKTFADGLLAGPIQASKALLAALPAKGCELVARGWMQYGVHYGHRERYSGTLQAFVNLEREAKVAPLLQTLATLPPADLQHVLRTTVANSHGRRIVDYLFTPAELRALAVKVPAAFNTLDAPDVQLVTIGMSVADARAVAPHLQRNPHPHAALLRGYAAAGTNLVSAILPEVAKSESWRFAEVPHMVGALWTWGYSQFHTDNIAILDRTGVDHGKAVQQYEEAFSKQLAALRQQVSSEANSQQRMAAFRKLYQEWRGTPATPTLTELWDKVIRQAPFPDKIEMLKILVGDYLSAPPASKDLQTFLLRQALGKMEFGNGYSKITLGPDFAGGWDRWGHQNVRNNAPALADYLEGLLKQQVAAGALVEPVFGMWLHGVNPQKQESADFMKELVQSPAYAKMDPAYHRQAAHHLLFREMALVIKSPTDWGVINRELLDLPEAATPQQVEAALKAVLQRAAQAPEPVAVGVLHKVAALPAIEGNIRKLVMVLFDGLSPLGGYPSGTGYQQLGIRIVNETKEAKTWGELVPYAASLWRTANSPDENRGDHRHHDLEKTLLAFSDAALEAGQFSVAYSMARTGLQNGTLLEQDRKRLGHVVSKAAAEIGAVEIPVGNTHSDYGIYKSNAEYVQGNLDSAWELYTQHAARLEPDPDEPDAPSLLREMTLGYAFWLLERNIAAGRADEAEFLVKELTIWSRQSQGMFSQQQDGLLNIAYADLAFLKGALPTARAWYRRVADAREHRGSELHVRAALGAVRIDRISKNFDSALEELDKLMRIRLPGTSAQVHFARAEVLMDQETYREALDEVDAVLREEPNHADALILRGQIQYQMRKLVEATEIELGVSQENKVIVPGESLKINLLDPTLSIAGVSVDIEVEVWAKSGDRERLMLHQLGDSKDKFRAEVPTALGPAVPGDKTLQVLGDDEIRYGYSERFRAKMKELPPDPDVVITVASDAHLALSAGAFPPREGERQLNIDELGLSTAQRALGTRTVRPGNPVYLRVIDPDQSRTAGADEVLVSLRATSGDEIRRIPLKETAPFSGEFEGVVPTASAQAMAFASEMAPGRDPNMVISAKDYPGWLGEVGNKGKPRIFGVDLNDNVPLAAMTIRWLASGQAITHFILQTSLNGRDWVTRARYPSDKAPWDGRPRLCAFPTRGSNGMSVSPLKGRSAPDDWREKMDVNEILPGIGYVIHYMPNLGSLGGKLIGNHPNGGVLIQFRALFYQNQLATRRFRLAGFPAEQETVFLVDGLPADEESGDAMTIERELTPGLHEIEVWRHEDRDPLQGRTPVLLCDVPGKDELQPCPDDMFDPTTFPVGIQAQIPQPASITNTTDGVEVAFGTNTQARLVRLSIQGFEGVAPGIRKMTLTDRDSQVRLPVAQDPLTLRQNMQLEVLPGDTITARYEDSVTATPGRDRHEQRLQVAFNDARISVSFAEFELLPTGERRLKLEPIRRFRHGDAILVVIDDVDMDSSPERDQVEFTITTSDGVNLTQRAVETEPKSGQFVGRIFPVEGKPARESELQMSEGATLTASFRDVENLNPGIPTDRTVTVQHAQYVEPVLGLYAVDSEPIPLNEPDGGADKAAKDGGRGSRASRRSVVQPRQTVHYRYVEQGGAGSGMPNGVIGCSLRFDVVVPHLALAANSTIHAYVQVSTPDSGQMESHGVLPPIVAYIDR